MDIQIGSCSSSFADSSSKTQDRIANGPAHQFASVEACCLAPMDPAHRLARDVESEHVRNTIKLFQSR